MSFRFFKRPAWEIRSVSAPWDLRSSIYNHIITHFPPDKPALKEGGETLPDEDRIRGNTGFGWAPGALDGTFGHHAGFSDSTKLARNILSAFRQLTEKATDERARTLYSLLIQNSAMEYIDQLVEAIAGDQKINADRLHAVASWIATESPDREPVKTSIAILGLLARREDRDLLLTLGRHEEFTLYAVVALQNAEQAAEESIWELGKYVKGWGRIHIVERLAGTQDARIKAWLLREGYKNDIMTEYTALICAKTGGLLEELRKPQADDLLLRGAGEILSAIIDGRGGPAAGVEAYPEGAEVAESYLRLLLTRKQGLRDFNVVATIERFLQEEEGEAHDVTLGWPQRRGLLLDYINAIRSRPGWEEVVQEGLASENLQQFWNAAQAAKVLGIDTWGVYFERLQRGEDQWYFVMQTDDPARIDKVIRFAEERLPLSEMASGPANELGLGPEFQAHSALDFVLQDLHRFPGKGWPLIRAGLQSPVTRNRNMAIRALSSWKREEWPEEADFLLRRALDREPNTDTRDLIRKLIAGQAIEP
ncbi:MAG TPA: hypothetical protein VF747_07560 [Blastocatellia bacterium]|jgi:hypothetical protein